ncbi:MAG: family 43 glycosylhydrolase [Clostridia bacterium]|nr:family 43 glycosylhydrolase [Clostridia bacterium]
MKASEINIRDPFVVYDNDTYYLYGTRAKDFGSYVGGMDVYVSNDLENWSEPIECFNSEQYGLNRKVNWAPEVHLYRDRYYMFATFTRENGKKGTYSLVADSLLGPFVPNSASALTPEDWQCLDGTLYVEDGVPYMIFCHEWAQIRDGEICSVRLSEDLRTAVGEPTVLFKASDLPCATDNRHNGFVTDGPFLYRTASDRLVMIWSSFDDKGYIEAVSFSENGRINGTWKHCEKPLSSQNGGHGMLFQDRCGELYFTMHSPNGPIGAERVRLFKMREIEKQPFFEFV